MSQEGRVQKSVYGMLLTRSAFGLMNVAAAFLMYQFKTAESALQLNGLVGSVGPFVQIAVGAMGIAGMAARKITLRQAVLLCAGMACLLVGTS
jgi:hypothetical protein